MGGPSTWRLGRAVALAAVVALHVGLLILVAVSLRAIRQASPGDFVTTLVLLPSAPRPAVYQPHPLIPKVSTAISAVEPRVPPSQIRAESRQGTPIDWSAEAERAASDAISRPSTRSFGEFPRAPDWLRSVPSSDKHHAGEQYQLGRGESVVWVSNRCFVVSEPPPLGMPDVFARSLGTHTSCQGPTGPREGELFKDLPAYRKSHPPAGLQPKQPRAR